MGNFENRVKFIMKYDQKKSLFEQATGPGITSFTPLYSEKKEDTEIKYPNNCRYPEKALPQSKQPDGTKGISNFCYYPQPNQGKKNFGKIAGIYLPENSYVEFWDWKSISDATDRFFEGQKLSNYGIKKEYLVKKFAQILKPGTVKSFKTDKTYHSWISFNRFDVTNGNMETVFFKGFFNDERQSYVGPKWVDKRNDYQKFVDEWGNILQWTTIVATAVAGLFCEGCTLPLSWELAIELGVGGMVGFREFEKGEDIAGTFSILTGLLPGLKYFKEFRGIDDKIFKSLSLKFAQSGLKKTSSIEDFIVFYNKLDVEEKKIIDKIFRSGDDYSKDELLKVLPRLMREGLGNKMYKEFMDMWKQNPELFRKIPLFERLWARELSSNLTFGVAQLLVQWKYGTNLDKSKSDKLTKEEKEKLDGLYLTIPDNLKKEISINLIGNPDFAGQIIDNLKKSPELQKPIDSASSKISGGLSEFYKKQKAIKDSVERAKGHYIQLIDGK